MRFRESQFGQMFFLPRPSEDPRDEQERRVHWLEVQLWCLDQWGPAQMGLHDRDFTTWKYFGLFKRRMVGEQYPEDRSLFEYDQQTGIYFKKPDDAFHFKMRWG